ncbi:site-2 protease family protein [Candidatus Zinderia endosymbiont of Aphrophora alni]|uniref:site-2 protease family protein n=1 Tax=Candidatus Zinderia endosymbiont of Aphrophora alni TaxID=3077951 RepID=UPI0030CB7CC3
MKNFFTKNLFFIFEITLYLFSISIHEFCHAYVGNYYGDNTLKSMGRLTLNPIKHIDFSNTFFSMLIFLFYFKIKFFFIITKELIINKIKLKHSIKKFFLVLLAGPLSNFILSIIFTIFYIILIALKFYFIADIIYYAIFINLGIFVINFFPFPFLDANLIMTNFFLKKNSLIKKELAVLFKMITIILIFFLFKKNYILNILLFLIKIFKKINTLFKISN